MRITRIESYGMDKLISGYKDFQNDVEYIKYGKKLSQFFENSEIILYLSDIKGIELLTLRRFCSSMIVVDSDGSSFDFVAPINSDILRFRIVRYDDEKIPSDKLTEVSSKIIKNYGILKKKLPSDKKDFRHWIASQCCDCGSYRFKVVARFEGVNITSLLSAFPETVFKIEGTSNFVDPFSKDMETLIAKKFITNFYNYMEETLSHVDTLTDVQFNRCYFNGIDDGECTLSHIRTPYGFIDWSSIVSSSDFVKKLLIIFGESDSAGYTINLLKDFTYHFRIRSTMESLIIFSAFSNLVYYYEDLKLLNGQKSNIPENTKTMSEDIHSLYVDTVDLLDTYRLDIVKKLHKEEKDKTKIHYNRIETYEFIPRSAYISFMIHGTGRDILKFIDDIYSVEIHTNEMDEIVSSLKNIIDLTQTVIAKISQ